MNKIIYEGWTVWACITVAKFPAAQFGVVELSLRMIFL